MSTRTQRRRASRKRIAYLAGLGAYAPLRDRYLVSHGEEAKLYAVEIERDGVWRMIGEFGDAAVAANHAQAIRDSVCGRTIANEPAATRVVASFRCSAPPVQPIQEDLAQIVEARPHGNLADKMDGVVGRKVKAGKRRIAQAHGIYLRAVAAARENASKPALLAVVHCPEPMKINVAGCAKDLALLGLDRWRWVSPDEVLSAFRRKARSAHPDGGGSTRSFQALLAARDRVIHDMRKGYIEEDPSGV